MAKAQRLSRCTRNPPRALNAMRRALKDTISLLQAIYVCDLLSALKRNGIALTTVDSTSKRLCKGLHKNRYKTVANMVMDWKIRDAKRVLREKKAKHTKLWREDEKSFKRTRGER